MIAPRTFFAFTLLVNVAFAQDSATQDAIDAQQRPATERATDEASTDDPTLPIEIPLSSIYALDMPGTKNVRDLEPDYLRMRVSEKELLERSVVEQIRYSLTFDRRPSKRAGHGFAVVGNPLSKTRDVLTGSKNATSIFPSDSDLWLMFFTCTSRFYVHIDGVWINHHRKEITIGYHLVRHSTLERTEHFALIPVGILPPGKYEVKIVQNPVVAGDRLTSNEPVEAAQVQRVICDPFGFLVHDETEGAFHGPQ